MENKTALQRRIRFLLILFILVLIMAGLTAIPLRWELALLNQWFGADSLLARVLPSMAEWIRRVNDSVQSGYGQYPLLAYGTDRLAFGHVAIAVAFIGPLRDPIKNICVIEFGMIACLLIIPWALIFGIVRGIPWFWTLIDMSFGCLELSRYGLYAVTFPGCKRNCDKIHRIKDVRQLTQPRASGNFISAVTNF